MVAALCLCFNALATEDNLLLLRGFHGLKRTESINVALSLLSAGFPVTSRN